MPMELFCRTEGKGPPALLLHGLGGDHSVWNRQVAALASHHRLLLPDLRGHGQTPAPSNGGYSFPEMEADVVALLDQERIEKVHLVGLSAGGFLALQTVYDRPTRIETLTLISAAPHCDAHTRAVGESWAEALRTGGKEGLILRLIKDLYAPDWVEEHMDFVDRRREQEEGADLRGVYEWGRAIRDFDLRGRLGRLRLPTLILHGMDDRVVDVAHARLLRQSIAGAKMRLFPRTGHMVPVERPQETSDAMREFLEARPP